MKVLAFDIFGTVVDWHGSIVKEVSALYPQVDANAFALAWRAGYQPAMSRVRSGELGWTRIDELHRLILEDLLPRFGLQHLTESERVHLNRVWHRLDPWPDSVEGLTRLKRKFTICSLPTAIWACSPTWPNVLACRGTACCLPKCSRLTNLTPPLTWAWPMFLMCRRRK